MKKIGLIVAVCIVTAVSWYWIAHRPPYPILDSGYWVDSGSQNNIYWIDNNRVIFAGNVVKEQRVGEEVVAGIFIWDIKNQNMTRLVERGSYLCYHDNYFHYSYNDGGIPPKWKWTIGEGSLQKFTEKPFVRLEGEAASYTARNLFTCRDFDRRQLPGYGDNRIRLALRDGHGFLDMGKIALGSLDMPLRLYPPGDTTGIELPLKQWQVLYKPITYVEFANAYLMYASQPAPRTGHTTWPKSQPYPIHFLSPDGAVRTVNIPYIKGMSGFSHFWATREGIVVSADGRAGGGSAHFVANDNQHLVYLFEGEILPAAVSPDGCKLAFKHTVYRAQGINGMGIAKVPPTLKIINFCK